MRVASETAGLSITAGGDSRIIAIGRFLRRSKLDELPQLWNVLVGEMSFVGPRPEVPKYVALYTDHQKRVLELRPGITDLASIEFRNEKDLLAAAENLEKFYIEYCIPTKIELDLLYARKAGVFRDAFLIVKTVFPFLHRGGGRSES